MNQDSIQAVILAGGRGERLRPLTDQIPKPLVPVNGKPYLVWQIEELLRQNISDILILTGYRGDQVEALLGSGEKWGARIKYSHEIEPLGTAGALIQAEEKLRASFLVLNGDSYLPMDFAEMSHVFHARVLPMLVATYDNRIDTHVPNNLKIENNLIVRYQKGAGVIGGFDAVDAGVYFFDRKIIARLKEQAKSSPSRLQNLEMLWDELINVRHVGSFPVNQRFYDIGTLDRLKEFETAILQGAL